MINMKYIFFLLLISSTTYGQISGRYILVPDTSKTVGNVDLSGYAKKADLDSFVTASDLTGFLKASDLTGYAKTSTLSNYVTTTVLNTKLPNLTDYLTATSAKTSFAPIVHTHDEYISKLISFTPVQTASFTLTAAHATKWIDVNCPSGCSVNLPNPSIFQPGTQILISNIGTGRVQFSPAAGVRILTEKNGIALTNINAIATLVVKNSDTWQISGSINP